MKTKALRLYGVDDLRLEEIELPAPGADELLVKIVSDSICMSSYKAAKQGSAHKRVPNDIAENPIIIGHEFCGEIIEAGKNVAHKYPAGRKFTLQPAMKGTYDAAGYSFKYLGGNAQYGIIPKCYLDQNCVLLYEGDGFFHGSLTEPLSCVIGAVHANYHTRQGEYVHDMGIKEGGNMAVLAGCGPMGLALIDYIIHCDRKPKLLVVTDINQERLTGAEAMLTCAEAAKNGVNLVYLNTQTPDAMDKMMEITAGHGFDDAFVFAPVAKLIEQADALLAYDGCLNFFAGPEDTAFSASLNFYNVHYNATHIVGTSGGNTADMAEALEMAVAGKLNPAFLVSHIGGLDAAAQTTKDLPKLPGFKKLIYNEISMPLTAIADFAEKGKTDALLKMLAEICERHNGLWSVEAEDYLLKHAPKL
ncbi:MAG: zinc-binding dehydrogenase [Defluviitaleaceae bacterium]|nr:zinc-binding dehydrogenase [Defluviitaleaceae bacterium]